MLSFLSNLANKRVVYPALQPILRFVVLLPFVCAIVGSARDPEGPELPAVKAFSRAIQRANLHKVLVVDFAEGGANRTQLGSCFAAVFSKTLSSHATSFEVIDRQKWFVMLQTEKITLSDLENPELLLHAGTELGAEALAIGQVEKSSKNYRIHVSLRSVAAGQELVRESYSVQATPELSARFPATSDPTGTQYYFGGLDGVTQHQCISCAYPSYTPAARQRKVQGAVVLSVLITTAGTTDQIVLLKGLDPDLDNAAIAAIKTSRLRPAMDASGTPVPVRISVEMSFYFR